MVESIPAECIWFYCKHYGIKTWPFVSSFCLILLKHNTRLMVCFLFALKDLAEHSCEEKGRACWWAFRYWLPRTHTHTRKQPIRGSSDPFQHYCIPYISPSLGYLFIWSSCPPPLLPYPSLSIPPSVWNKRLRLGLDPSHFLLTSPSFSICRILWHIFSCLCVITSS